MFFVNDPGPWQSFVLRGDNVGRPINEITQKYINEQLQFENFISMEQQIQLQQYQNKGPLIESTPEINNTVLSVAFGGDNLETISGFNNAEVNVTFEYDVEVTGTPFIEVTNAQDGEGAASSVNYNFLSGDGTNTLIFVYQQSSAQTNVTSNVGAYRLAGSPSVTPSSPVNTLSGCTNGTYTVTATWAAGTVTGDTQGGNVSGIQVTVVSNNITVINTTGRTIVGLKRFTPGNTLTIQGSALGAEGAGTYIFTINQSMLGGDVNDLNGTSIDLNGGSIDNVDGGTIDLSYTSGARKIAVAS
jgi:hypothetical protein